MRKLSLFLLGCIGILFVGYAGYRSYVVWKKSHMLGLAQQFLAKADRRNEILCLEQVLRSDKDNVEAARMMAELAEASRLPAAVLWRSRVVELNPFSFDDRLALVQTAMTMKDLAAATNALAGFIEADKKKAAYQNIAGALAAALNQGAEAEAHFLEACRLEPHNPVPQLNLAVIRLHETNAAGLEEARSVLRALSSNPTNSGLRCQALRELTIDALRYKETGPALNLSKQLLKETNATFADSILRLSVLQETRNAGFNQALKDCEHAAAEDGGRIYELGNWEISRMSPGDAVAWLRTLPKNAQTSQPAAFLITECYTMMQAWRDLRAWLEPQKWGEIEFVRHAFQSRALRGMGLEDSGKVEWEQAMKAANGQKQSLVMLLNLATQWRWFNEGEELLHSIVTKYPNEQWAKQALTRTMFVSGQTRSLMEFYSQEVKKSKGNLGAKNNLAMTAMLLDAQEFKPYELAHEVYQQSPTNSSFISTYAFSLYAQKKNNEALKIIEKLKPEELQDPSISGYYGLILKANGNRAKAKTFLSIASKARALPEERKLFDKAGSDI